MDDGERPPAPPQRKNRKTGTDIWSSKFDRQLGRVVDAIRFGEITEAFSIAAKVASGAREAGDRFALGRALMFSAEIELLRGKYERARAYCNDSERILRRIRLWGGVSRVCRLLADCARAEGNFAEAWRHVEEAISFAEAISTVGDDADVRVRNLFECHVACAALLCDENRIDEGLNRVREAEALTSELTDPLLIGDFQLVRALLERHQNLDRGLELVRKALRIFSTNRLILRSAAAHEAEGDCLLSLGDLPAARRSYQSALALYEEAGTHDVARVGSVIHGIGERLKSAAARAASSAARRAEKGRARRKETRPTATAWPVVVSRLLEPGLQFPEFCQRLAIAAVADFGICGAAAVVQDLGGGSIRILASEPGDSEASAFASLEGAALRRSLAISDRPRISLELQSGCEGKDLAAAPDTIELLQRVAMARVTDDVAAELEGGSWRHRVDAIKHGMVIVSLEMHAVLDKLYKAAQADCTVLLTGESGTGKERLARVIHDESQRASALFLPTNCAALPSELVESKLFGHRRGAFTGASSDSPGMFRAADKGTLFLDEIGELPLALQPKLLRALDVSEIEPVGTSTPVRVDTRVIAATNRDLEREVAEGRFRKDLFHRLNVFTVCVPPLRVRPADIIPLARYFVERACKKHGIATAVAIQPAAESILLEHSWPGNVRELLNAVTRALLLNGHRTIRPQDIQLRLGQHGADPVPSHAATSEPDRSYDEILADVSQRTITETLRLCGGSRKEACRRLQMTRGRFYRIVHQLGLNLAALAVDDDA